MSNIKRQTSNIKIMKKKRLLDILVKMLVAALTAFLTALGTTSCIG